MKAPVNLVHKRRVAIGFFIVALLMVALTFRVAWIQIVDAEEYTEKAILQQTNDTTIQAKRGIIYDRNGKELATSTTCYTLWVWPSQFTYEKTDEEIKEMCAKIAEIIDKDEEKVLQNATKETLMVSLAKYLDKETADKIRALKYSGLELAEGTKRNYPLGNFASQVLGSVNDDNQGRTGLELQYDEYLSGVPGRWVKNTDISGNELVEGREEYHEAQDGLNVVTTLDEAIQYYVEKAINEGMEKTGAKRIMCLIMDPKTGDILASAVTPGFDPNNATVPTDETYAEEYKKAENKSEVLSKMWRNPIVSDTYEPGSTFKLITASSAIEEKAITTTETFSCNSRITVAGVTLHCWSNRNHGTQTIKQAVGNSCNPVMAKVATKMGKKTFYKYLDLYGITEKTGVDYPGEAGAIVQSLENVGPVELATIGYGQGISVTPIQLLTAVSAIGNDGVLMQPRYVKALTDSEGRIVEEYEPKVVRKVISTKTANEMKEIMEYVVAEAGGGNAKITGYRIGGKTGTANKVENGSYGKNYYSSFIGMAPMDDPKVSILVVVDSPKGSYYGSIVAAPIAKSILSDVLRYMNISPEYTDAEKAAIEGNYTVVPDVVGREFSEAAGILGGKDLKYSRPKSARDDDNFTVVDQYPKAGTKVKKNSVVYVYKE
ncbi:MAG: penicillin-binding transpeptidase domain-containing protein [Anaerovoracaceae bacterium]